MAEVLLEIRRMFAVWLLYYCNYLNIKDVGDYPDAVGTAEKFQEKFAHHRDIGRHSPAAVV